MSKAIKLIFILGGPGAGKSTVANIITTKIPKSTVLKTGQVVRNAILQDKDISHQDRGEVSTIMQHGGLVKDDIVTLLLSKEIKTVNETLSVNCFIMDGFPRTINQLKKLTDGGKFVIGGALFLTAPHEIMEKRCKMRNLRTDRVDDCKGPVETRIHDYKSHVDEIKDELKKRSIPFFEIDTCEDIPKMTTSIEGHLKQF